ncbi:MAG: glucosaminidase domain-containing protein [Herpetosiphonaceae bacterium]|nr:glucosaminidase domain-containing protein [Herpetosiphonaceae bacterium]
MTKAWGAVLLLGLLLLPGRAAAQTGQTTVVGPPSISGATVSRIVAGTPLAPYATQIYQLGAQATIDPAFALAIWDHESQFGTTGAAVANHNMGNLICDAALHPPATGCNGRWAVYAAWPDAISDWYGYINRRYISKGLTTVEQILYVYAPPSENNTQGYITTVETLMRQWGSGVVGTTPPPTTGGGNMIDEWIRKSMDEMWLTIYRQVAALGWFTWRGMASVVLMIEQVQNWLTTVGFKPVIDAVAQTVLGFTQSVYLLAIVLAGLVLILTVIIRLRIINLPKLALYVILVPVLLPSAGYLWQQAEQARANLGSSIYTAIFQKTSGQFPTVPGSSGGSVDTELPPIVAIDPALGTGLHGIDLAAAYLYFNLADVQNPGTQPPDDLPVAFKTKYFPQDAAQLAGDTAGQRADADALGWHGVERMWAGGFLIAFALIESVINLLWTLALGVLVIGLILASLFGWFAPVEHIMMGIGRKLLEVFMASWGISAVEGVVMAITFTVAAQQDATALWAVMFLFLFLMIAFLFVAGKIVAGAFMGVGAAITGGAMSEAHVAGASQVMQAGASLTTGGATAVGGAAMTGATQVLKQGKAAASGGLQAATAYRMARGSGADRSYAAAYALGHLPAVGQAGALARAMGRTIPQPVERAIFTRQVTERTGALGPLAGRHIDQDIKTLNKPTPPKAKDATQP